MADPTTDGEVLERAMTQLALDDVATLAPNATIRARSELGATSAPALPSIALDPPSSERATTDSSRSTLSDYTTIAFDLLIASMAYAFAAIALRREVWICVPILTAGLVSVLCWPHEPSPSTT